MLLCLTSLFFAGFRSVPTGAGLAPPPERTVEVTLSRSGFAPSTVEARRGETVHLRLTSGDQEHCFALEAFRVEKRVAPGRTTAVDITPDRAGTFPFYCCLESGTAADTEKGRLIVAE